MKRHMDPAHHKKVRGLKYSYSMKRHMDPAYGGKVRGLKYSYSMKRHMDPDYMVGRSGGLNTPIL